MKTSRPVKRAFDFTCALFGLVLLAPLFALVALIIVLDSGRPAFFRQERVGRRFLPIRVFKFRTMVSNAIERGPGITVGEDPRITRVGRWLRRTKLDELPQLVNVLLGDMSLVGPRPELPSYVALFPSEFERILRVRPGITDSASLFYRDESAVLACAADPEAEYRQRILPHKLKLSAEGLEASSLRTDLALIFRTILGYRSPTLRP